VTKLAKQENPTIKSNNAGGGGKDKGPRERDMYFYHPDHLGSSSYVTDEGGRVFQHLEYFPFGETWVEEKSNTQRTPYLFTGKELDEDTGLYYFGARYYDQRTSVWVTVDPILNKYLPTGDEKKDGKLPGMGGAFNSTNLNLYHYAGQNPVFYVDPNGLYQVGVKAGYELKNKGLVMSAKELSYCYDSTTNSWNGNFTFTNLGVKGSIGGGSITLGSQDLEKTFSFNVGAGELELTLRGGVDFLSNEGFGGKLEFTVSGTVGIWQIEGTATLLNSKTVREAYKNKDWTKLFSEAEFSLSGGIGKKFSIGDIKGSSSVKMFVQGNGSEIGDAFNSATDAFNNLRYDLNQSWNENVPWSDAAIQSRITSGFP